MTSVLERKLTEIGVPEQSLDFVVMWIKRAPTRWYHLMGAAHDVKPLPIEARRAIECMVQARKLRACDEALGRRPRRR